MDLMLRVTLLSLLCLLAEAQPLNRPQQNGRWNPLEVPENRELFLSALQNYFSSRGIHVERTGPAFIPPPRNHEHRSYRRQEEEELEAAAATGVHY